MLTVHYFSGGPLAEDLIRFMNGHPRSHLRRATLEEIYKLTFILCAEVVIEQKHDPVSIAEAAHSIGPVMVSLCNRMPMLEHQLHAEP